MTCTPTATTSVRLSSQQPCRELRGTCILPFSRYDVRYLPLSSPRKSRFETVGAASVVHEGQSSEDQKGLWQQNLRSLTGRRKHHEWETHGLDPPPVLDRLCVVMIAPKIPRNVGAVARTCGAFECMDLRVVTPRYQFHLARVARNTAKGSQHIMFRSQIYGGLEEALADCEYSVALTRWADGGLGQPQYTGMAELLAGTLAGRLSALPAGRKVALVLGREDAGFLPQEVAACDAVASIPMGRLQESLSIGHAISIALAAFFDHHSQPR